MKTLNKGEVIFNTYEVLDLIDQGGMGNIYKVKHLKIPKIFALKQLKIESNKDILLSSFISEISILNRIKHPNILKIYDSFHYKDNFFYTMEFIEGQNIKKYFLQNDIQEEKILKYFSMSINALNYLHSKSIIHRDIKPSNILIDNLQDIVKIIDFGISNIVNRDFIFLTPGYSPPEQYQKEQPKPENDIFSLGITFLEILSQSKPPENLIDYEKYIKESLLKAREKVSESFLDIIKKCVEIDINKRFKNTQQIISILSQKFKIDNQYIAEFNQHYQKVEKIINLIERKIESSFKKGFYEVSKFVDILLIKVFEINEFSIYFLFERESIEIYFSSYFEKSTLMEKISYPDLESDLEFVIEKTLHTGGTI